jgi:drug/metabolite transporter (DMT)-like permease
MTWLFVALAAYFLISLNITLDKVILKNSIPHPVVYCFYMGLLSIFGLVFLPFGKLSLDWNNILTGIVVGAVFLGALFVMYKAIFAHEASRVGPIIGAVTPIFVSLFSFLLLKERLGWQEFVAFALLVAGGILISVDLNSIDKSQKRKAALRVLGISILSALIFGIYYVLLKHVYNQGTFVSGFCWTRFGSFLASFLFLIPGSNRQLIFSGTKTLKLDSGVLVLFNKTLSGIAFALLNYAIAIGSVTLVNAMQGLQYVFLLIVVAFFSKKYPKILSEQIHKKALTQKIIAIIIIGLGLAMTAM